MRRRKCSLCGRLQIASQQIHACTIKVVETVEISGNEAKTSDVVQRHPSARPVRHACRLAPLAALGLIRTLQVLLEAKGCVRVRLLVSP